MQNDFEKYSKKGYIVFSVDIKQKENKDGNFKKDLKYPKDWEKFEESYYNSKYNSLAMQTGKRNNIIVVDIDNVEHWEELLEENCKDEPETVKAISGSGGIHLYFKYSEDLGEIKSNSKSFGQKYDIDIRSNGGNIIIPPSKYHNKNLNKEVEYKWERSIFDCEIKSFPQWMKKILLNTESKEVKKKKLRKTKIEEPKKEMKEEAKEEIIEMMEVEEEDKKLNFTIKEIEKLLEMLSEKRKDNYSDWINVGLCLHNINDKYLVIWDKWSCDSEKYKEGECEKCWEKFKKNKEGLKIGSLLLWAKIDNKDKYEEFIKEKRLGHIVKIKYPNENLILGDRHKVNDKTTYVQLKNKECLIKGGEHKDMPNSMHLNIVDKFMTIICRHPECFGKCYPCNHVTTLTKNEMVIANNENVNIYINQKEDDDLVEFQQIDIYEDKNLNKLVYDSLNGESYPFAKIVYYFYENMFRYSEDDDWYMFANHKWKCIGKKNMELRDLSQDKLKDLYSQLLNYYKENDYDKNKIKSLKQTIKSLDNTNLKNNILTELMEIYTINKNPDRDFITKLDSNNHLIGFKNGVYDLTKFEFREGNPDDYITMSVGYNYSEQHTEKYNELLQFLQDIQPNKEERDYMLTYFSIGLIGNLLELFTILTGCGRNGKSKLVELLKFTFGDYFGAVQSQLFTRPRPDANSPDPGLLSLMKKKIVIASEPEKNSRLNSGFIKFITGRDSTTLRNCHSNDMIDFTANFITLLICNDIPDCDDIDNAFSKRLRCINFPTEFVVEPKKENQKIINVNINKNFDYWKLDFMLLLIEHYKKYTKTHELKATNNILKWTEQYKENTDLYLQFLNENTEENPEGHIHCSTLYETFKYWFKNNNPNTKIPSNKEFVNNLKKYKDLVKVRVENETRLGIKNIKLI
jgi:P4 family phage/plasmid primase-like protien